MTVIAFSGLGLDISSEEFGTDRARLGFAVRCRSLGVERRSSQIAPSVRRSIPDRHSQRRTRPRVGQPSVRCDNEPSANQRR